MTARSIVALRSHAIAARFKGASLRIFALLLSTSIVLAACGGGGGGSVSPSSSTTPTPGATATPVSSESESVQLSGTGTTTASYSLSSLTATVGYPSSSTSSASLATIFSTNQPASVPTIQSMVRKPANIGASPLAVLAYLSITANATTTLSGYPALQLVVPASVLSAAQYSYVAWYNPANSAGGWNIVEGPGTVSGTTLNFTSATPGPTLQANQTYYLAVFTLASAAPTPTPTSVPTPTPAPSATVISTNAATAFTCPANDSEANGSSSGRGAIGGVEATRRASGLRVARPSVSVSGLLAVTYTSAVASGTAATQAVARETAAGGTLMRTFNFSRTGKVIHVVSVPTAQMNAIAAKLRTQSGVQSVAPTGALRYPMGVSAPYFTTDPYFNGFTATQNAAASNPAPTTYHVAPYEETSAVPGQWDMHAIGLQNAFAYSQSGNTVAANASALGSASVKLAVIDSGEDPTHPELSSKIAYQRCFITNAAGTAQSKSDYETDPLGHGTDTAGIAAEDTNNGFGFTGTGGKTSIYAYRVFPTPDDNCANPDSDDTQCGADTVDIADAITDAVAQGVNVISMSLGGATCGSGSGFASNGDSDPTEGAAVAEAIAANVIVVAASGNSGGSGVASPACDSGVIAVGASSLADGTTNGSAFSGGSATAPVEYVANYSQYGTTNTPNSATSWGIVAPGGDPSGDTDTDDLHWIENIWTSTPYMSSSSDSAFEGECDDDYPNGASSNAPVDCRTLIAGTSMATPHVAGAAALILAVNPSYQSPTAMKALLCQTADPISNSTSLQGCGRLDVYRAMATALNDPSPPNANPTP